MSDKCIYIQRTHLNGKRIEGGEREIGSSAACEADDTHRGLLAGWLDGLRGLGGGVRQVLGLPAYAGLPRDDAMCVVSVTIFTSSSSSSTAECVV